MSLRNDGIVLAHCGQPGPYQDSIYSGTVASTDEADARRKLAEMRGVKQIRDRQDAEHWSSPYFTEFKEIEPGTWRFRIIEEYTG